MNLKTIREATIISGLAAMLVAFTTTTSAEPLPTGLQGTWRIARVLPTSNTGCWSKEQALPLVGTTLTYRSGSMKWRGGDVPLAGFMTRTLSQAQFHKENSGDDGAADFTQLGIRAAVVTEVNMQHEDADITGSTTEVPGDSVLLAGPNRIVVSACGVFFEATRTSGLQHTTVARR